MQRVPPEFFERSFADIMHTRYTHADAVGDSGRCLFRLPAKSTGQGEHMAFLLRRLPANLSNPHDFKKGNAITAEDTAGYKIGTKSSDQVKKTYSFYPAVPGRVHNIYAEADCIYFNNTSNIGFEADVKGGVHDPDDDNLGIRLGVFVPVGTKDKKPILVEPLVRLKRLSGNLSDFMKDHFVVGFNVTVKFSDFRFYGTAIDKMAIVGMKEPGARDKLLKSLEKGSGQTATKKLSRDAKMKV